MNINSLGFFSFFLNFLNTEMEKLAAKIEAQKEINKLLKVDAVRHRKKLSETCAHLKEYIVANQSNDPLVTGFSSTVQNPYKDKSGCDLI